jgi:hypothetical protein
MNNKINRLSRMVLGIILAITVVSCSVGPPNKEKLIEEEENRELGHINLVADTVITHERVQLVEKGDFDHVYGFIMEAEGMKYLVINRYNGGVSTINLTNDKLENEVLQLQLSKLKHGAGY